jgi:hypothetical protein
MPDTTCSLIWIKVSARAHANEGPKIINPSQESGQKAHAAPLPHLGLDAVLGLQLRQKFFR